MPANTVQIQLVRASKGKTIKTENYKIPKRHLNHCRKSRVIVIHYLILTTRTILAFKREECRKL